MGSLGNVVRLNWWRRNEVKVCVGESDSCVSRHCSKRGQSQHFALCFFMIQFHMCLSSACGETPRSCVLESHWLLD